jgi:hypothetical protein
MLLKQNYQGKTWHDKCRYKSSQDTSLCSILQAGPAVHIEITSPIHVFWVDCTGVWVYHVIVNKYLVPRSDEAGVDIEGDFQIPVHAKETGQGAIRGIMKCHAIWAIDRSVAQEILVLARGKIGRSKKSRWSLRRSPASSARCIQSLPVQSLFVVHTY